MADKVELDIEINSTKAEKSLENLEKAAIKSTSNMEKAFSGLKNVAIAAVSIFAVKSVFDFFEAGIEGAVAQEQAMARLQAQMEATGENTEAAAKQFNDLASELESTTKFGDDAVLAAAALAKSFGISNDEAIKLTKAAADLASATGDTLEGAVTQLTNSYSGNIKTIGKLVPELKSLTKEQLAAGEGVTLLANRFAGAANKEIQTYGGAIIQATNSFQNFGEAFGTLITQNAGVVAFINGIGTVFQSLQKIIEENGDSLSEFIKFGVQALVTSLTLVLPVTRFAVTALEGFLFGVTAAFTGILQAIRPLVEALDFLQGSTFSQTASFDKLIDASARVAEGTLKNFGDVKKIIDETSKSTDKVAQSVFDATEVSSKGFGKAEKSVGKYKRQVVQTAEETEKLSQESKKFLEGLTVSSATELDKIGLETQKAFDQLDIFVKKNAISEADARTASFQITSIQIQKTNALVEKGLKETVDKAKAAGEEARTKIQEAASNPIKFFLEKLKIEIEPIEATFDPAGLAAGISVLKNVFNGKEGAETLVGGIAGGIVGAFAGPVVGGLVQDIVSQLAKGSKESNDKLTEFIKALPIAITNATEAIPDVLENLFTSETFIEKMGTAILRIVTFAKLWEKAGEILGLSFTDNLTFESVFTDLGSALQQAFRDIGSGINDIMAEIGRFLSDVFQNGGQGLIDGFKAGLTEVALFFVEDLPQYIVDAFQSIFTFFQDLDIANSISGAFDGIVKFFTEDLPNFIYNAFKPIIDFFEALDFGGDTDFSKPSNILDPGGIISSAFGLSKGGIVYAAEGFKPRGTDTIPAMLTPGEMVLNRGQQSALFDLANGGGSSGNADMLQQIIDLLSEPMTTEVSAEINGRGIADIILQQSRQRARLSA